MARLASFLFRLTMGNASKRAAMVTHLSKILKAQGLGNNNTKRAETAELLIKAFTNTQHLDKPTKPLHTRKPRQEEAPEVLGKSDIARQ